MIQFFYLLTTSAKDCDGEGGTKNYKYWDEMGCNGTKKDDFLEI